MRKLYAFLFTAFLIFAAASRSAAQNYTFTTSAGNAIVPGTTLEPGSSGDDLTVLITLPFSYSAYNVAYTQVRASSNGNLQFTGAGNTSFSNTCPLPTTTTLGFPDFMPHWDDLHTGRAAGQGIYTSTSGVAPNRIFNIEWRGELFTGSGNIVNFEARLFEGQQRVDFIYGTVTNNGSSASIGVQGAVGPTTLFTSFSCNTASLSSGLGISFVLAAPCSGVPSPGFITGPAGIICPGTATALTLNGYTTGGTITLQWASSATSGGPYTPIAGATNPIYNFTATATRYYICTVTCGASGFAANTTQFTLNVDGIRHTSVTATPAVSCAPGNVSITGTAADGVVPSGFVVAANSGTINLAIPDANPTGVSSTIVMPATSIPNATSMQVRINANHSWVGDILFRLTSPCGVTFLFDRPGTTGAGFGNADNLGTNNSATPPPAVYTFDVSAATIIPETAGATGFIAGGSYIPSTAAGASNTTWAPLAFPCAAAGNWTLTAIDAAGGDFGTLVDWQILTFSNGVYTHTLTGPGTITQNPSTGPNNSTGNFSVSGLPAGNHVFNFTSTDMLGCSVTTPVNVTVNPLPTILITPGPPVTNNYVFTTSNGNAIVPGTTFVPGTQADDATATIALPFNYSAYGNSYSSIIVSTNGNIQFSGAGNTSFSNTCPLPTTTTLGFPNFMPYWDDLLLTAGGAGIYTSVSGVAPNRIFNIEWRGVTFSGALPVNFEARLFEGQQRVDYIYGTNPDGASASIGVQGAVGPTTLVTSYSCNTAASISSGLGISFVIPPPTICEGQILRLDAGALPGVPQTLNSGTVINIPGTGSTGNASPYPGTINVSGYPTAGVTVRSVTINNYDHTFPDDVDLVLVSPTGTAVILMSDCGGGTSATGQNFTFLDGAPALADAAFNPTGTYRCTNYGTPDNFPAPGPGNLTQATPTLSSFIGDPNGDWKLYAVDDLTLNTGLIGSWSITFNVPGSVTFSQSPASPNSMFTDPGATTAYTGTLVNTIWVKPTVTTTYTVNGSLLGCNGSNSITVNVNKLPAITTQPTPAAQTVCPGFNVTYTVTATGTGITYQWRRNGVNLVNGGQISGATSNSLTITNVNAANAGTYDVVITGVCTPAVTSNGCVLTIASAPTITTQPANATVCAGQNATFSVVAAGTPAPSLYQWQVSTDGGATWNNLFLGGALTPTLTLTNVTVGMNGNRYRCIITNFCGQNITTNSATLTVNATPTVVATDLFNQKICLSDTLVPLVGTPTGGSWSGIGVSGFNFVPTATAVGTYVLTYTYTNAVGCTATDTTTVKVTSCPERQRLLRNNAVILYPNPNNGKFNIRINSTLYNYLGMKVYDMTGRLVNGRVVKNGIDQALVSPVFSGLTYGRVIPIDISYLPSGTYLVKFYYDDGARSSEKGFLVVIQR